MIPKRIAVSLVIFLLTLPVACATGISEQARSQVTYTGSFTTIQKDPGGHVGSVVILGGKILETQASSTSSEIVLLQLPLEKNDRPKDGDRSEGRFLLRASQFLDPAIYHKGTLLTVVGRVSGSEVRTIGSSDYVYPVVESIEIKHWPERSQDGPGISLGVGVGSGGGGGAGIGFGF